MIDPQGVLNGTPGGPEDVILKDGDKLIVPKKTEEVTILGEVQSPTSHVYKPGLTRDDYIAKSGGTTQNADHKRIYIVRANGDVVAGDRSGWFRRSHESRCVRATRCRAARHARGAAAAALAGDHDNHL